eukprot:TRINITY_DN52439_c0_g1_i1.p1 TRINITY_DN52439_c0_g1~~TRINITY_DN52439_c0_g1_i1.p1  ORF type:complete len:317 (+),score=-6.93 TRINITY_DN52439_c0_g1_i1:50-952(+)
MPILRQLLKIHKKVLDTRLLTAATRWITSPAAVLLAVELQPVCRNISTVAFSTSDVTSLLQTVPLTSDTRISTFDVERLYPSMNHERIIAFIRRLLCDYYSSRGVYSWGAKVEALCRLIHIVLKNQLASFTFGDGSKQVYVQTTGVSMGVACACQLANLFLSGLDHAFASECRNLVFGYQRYIDDILVAHKSALSTEAMLRCLNRWDTDIVVTHESEEDNRFTHFLDLNICIRTDTLKLPTYRKPLCAYSFTSFSSDHPSHVFKGVVATELVRLLRTNTFEHDFTAQQFLFFAKLRDRGY